ncbi:hypothetical protein ABZT02_34355 [Streptomyces sp. NPDC005402]|uniref:hypothetical protein n=1 Tax=Streptomyces sp. NPDC005402 TaxID=3155338 RepID=UPI0033B8696E
MKPDSWIFTIATVSMAVAVHSVARLFVLDKLSRWLEDREYRKIRKNLTKLIEHPGLSDEARAEIKLVLAEADLLRATGLKEEANERESEGAAKLSPEVGEMLQ